jgi:hypothetical protein
MSLEELLVLVLGDEAHAFVSTSKVRDLGAGLDRVNFCGGLGTSNKVGTAEFDFNLFFVNDVNWLCSK